MTQRGPFQPHPVSSELFLDMSFCTHMGEYFFDMVCILDIALHYGYLLRKYKNQNETKISCNRKNFHFFPRNKQHPKNIITASRLFGSLDFLPISILTLRMIFTF